MDKVIAVVVTYNRLHLLTECISALRNQTQKIDKILVINNGSTDGTQLWLQQQNDLDFITQKNSGSAGGFFTGIKKAYAEGFSWIWLMDDDGYSKKDALENLLADSTEELCLRNCAIINKDDKESFVWKTKNYKTLGQVKQNVINNVAHPFNGTLLHRKIVERVGLPKSRLFLWGDETEYYYRIIRKNKIPFCTIANSIHYHPAAGFNYKKDWELNSGWKMYYYIRNRFFVLQSKFYKNSILALFLYAGFLLAFAGTILFFQKTDRVKKLSFIFWPAVDALSNNFNVTPSFISRKLNAGMLSEKNTFSQKPLRISRLFAGPPVISISKLERA